MTMNCKSNLNLIYIRCILPVFIFILIYFVFGFWFLKSRPSLDGPYAQTSDNVFTKFNFKDDFDQGIGIFHLNLNKTHFCSKLKYFDIPKASVALVSFPGSGNTWLRYLLQQATGIYTGSVYSDKFLKINGFLGEGINNGSVLVVKTHEYGVAAQKPFMKAIMLIRDLKSALAAEFDRTYGGGHLETFHFQYYNFDIERVFSKFVNIQLKRWKELYLNWIKDFPGPIHVVHYENLVKDLEKNLLELLRFLEIPVNKDLFSCTLAQSKGIYQRKHFPKVNLFSKYLQREIKIEEDYIKAHIEYFELKKKEVTRNV